MQRNIDVLAEMRKFADHKPVHAVAGIGVLASRTLRELPWRLVHWTRDNPPNSLPGRATGAVQTAQSHATGAVQAAQSRATGAVQTAQSHATGAVQSVRGKASDGYDTLAAHGKKAMNGQSSTTERKSTAGGQGKPELNGKPKAKAPTRATTGH
jgi:hypothetical protein